MAIDTLEQILVEIASYTDKVAAKDFKALVKSDRLQEYGEIRLKCAALQFRATSALATAIRQELVGSPSIERFGLVTHLLGEAVRTLTHGG